MQWVRCDAAERHHVWLGEVEQIMPMKMNLRFLREYAKLPQKRCNYTCCCVSSGCSHSGPDLGSFQNYSNIMPELCSFKWADSKGIQSNADWSKAFMCGTDVNCIRAALLDDVTVIIHNVNMMCNELQSILLTTVLIITLSRLSAYRVKLIISESLFEDSKKNKTCTLINM